ncbi:hypothetical protein [Bifidobacterium bombi]|uniref:hypothetical protein n=1 Tax=Bifidobacterium bombi TaxID=471511 RepID=UPI0005C597C6|nr:hypothetical protein [Bifidobacterium bombi]
MNRTESERAKLIAELTQIEQQSEAENVSEKKKQERDLVQSDSDSLSTNSDLAIVVAFIVLVGTILVCSLMKKWNYASVGAAVATFLFLYAIIEDMHRSKVEKLIPQFTNDYEQAKKAADRTADAAAALKNMLPSGYSDPTAIRNMLRAMQSGYAQTPEEARQYQDVCKRRADEQQAEQSLLNQLTAQANEDQDTYEAELAKLEGIQAEISHLQSREGELDAENDLFLMRIGSYSKEKR